MAAADSEAASERSGVRAARDEARPRPNLRPVPVDGQLRAESAERRPQAGPESGRETESGVTARRRDVAEQEVLAKAPEPVDTPRSRWPLWTLLAVLLAMAAAGSWYWFEIAPRRQSAGAAGPAAKPPRVPVEVADARASDVPVYLAGLGTVQPFNNVVVRSRVDGELTEIAFQEGQTVREGDLLARIDPRPYQAALDQAVAKKAQDEATLASLKLDLQRTQQLAQRSFASQQQLDQQTANVAAQTALVASDQAAIDNARTQLGYTTIRAPISGRTACGSSIRATSFARAIRPASSRLRSCSRSRSCSRLPKGSCRRSRPPRRAARSRSTRSGRTGPPCSEPACSPSSTTRSIPPAAPSS